MSEHNLTEAPDDWLPTFEDKVNAIRLLRRVARNPNRRNGTRWLLLALAEAIQEDVEGNL